MDAYRVQKEDSVRIVQAKSRLKVFFCFDKDSNILFFRFIVLAGGNYFRDYVQLLDLSSMVWYDGPRMPVNLYGAATVPFKRSFLIVGGFVHDVISGGRAYPKYSNEIYQFDAEGMR